MLKLKGWLLSLLVLALTAVPVMAGNNDAKTESENTANTTATEGSPSPSPSLGSSTATGDANVTALLGVLVMKGVLAPTEANAIKNATPTSQFQVLVDVLSRKGLLTAADLAAAASPAAQPSTHAAVPETAIASSLTSVESQSSPQPGPPPPPPGPSVVPAIAPLRVLPVDPPKKDALNAAFKLGPVKMTPYGFLKATGVYDTSNPNGDDMPFPGLFLSSANILSTGPTKDPEFHLKARSSRIGANFEWGDLSPKVTLTGRIEGDFEGNFSEVDNRDVSSIRSSMFSFRQAWVRMDYAASDKTDIYFEGGQDWTLFGSSALPNLLETTALGYWYGDIYERSPQFQFGLVQKLGSSSRNFKLAPTFAIMMPSTGQIEKLGTLGLQGQIAQAEREGADSGRPEFEGRLALQFQLDKAPAVAPAQIFWSGFRGKRTSIVPSSSMGEGPAAFAAAFPSGFTSSSTMWGNQLGLQLPTRWFTLVVTGYRGGDLRFFFGGQVNTFFTDTGGLSGVQSYSSLDGGPLAAAGAPALGCTGTLSEDGTTCSGSVVVAPERPIRAFGGFVNLGLPLSRWFNADPKGHNAGWQLYLHAGKDQVVSRDLHNPNAGAAANVLSPLPLRMGKLAALTLYYKYNPYVSFGFEQSIYATRLEAGANYTIEGKPSNEWQDHRTEFGPIFTF
ncbi:MAG TPA: hypothetical protein VJX69_00655 [Terriglobales bacterium]|nr:hypothetical protein [Terriglobales bacterium]